jgi:dTDP-4-dehydrorhamnose reductase
MADRNKILVIGATGMLGAELSRQLKRQGEYVIEAIWPDDGSDRILLDITDATAVKKLISAVKPTAVYNCAAYTDVDKSEQEEQAATAVNGTGVGYLAQACLENNSLLAHVSTDYVFDGMGKRPYRPDDATNPQSAYGRSKLAGEEAIRSIDGKWLIVRTSWLFGRGGKNFVDTILKLAAQRDMLRVVDDQTGCPTYVRDLANCLTGLTQTDCQGVFHFCNGPACTWYEFAKKIVEIAQLPCRVEPCKSSEYQRPARRPQYSVLDCSETFEQLGWKPCSWEERLYEYIKAQKVGV